MILGVYAIYFGIIGVVLNSAGTYSSSQYAIMGVGIIVVGSLFKRWKEYKS